MLIRKLDEIKEFVAGDGSKLKEILHPDKQPVDIRYSIARASVRPGEGTLPHTLSNAEVYYIISGCGRMHIGNEAKDVGENDAVYVPAGAIQSIENTGAGNLEFLCIVDPAWQPEIERVIKH
jgi:mannose-6-phosphate isomerase-like protein (cupin superfamily)